MAKNQIMSLADLPVASLLSRLPIDVGFDSLGAVTRFLLGAFNGQEQCLQGFIVNYNPHTHSASVKMSGSFGIWTCVFADEFLSYSFGYSESSPPREGEYVLVQQINQVANAGVIIGRIPYPLRFNKKDLYQDPYHYHRMLYTQLQGTRDLDIPCFMDPLLNPNDDSTHIATHYRPTDVFPGEFARVNQHNCGIKGGMFSTTLLGGGASLRLSALSNLARLTCEHFQRHTMHSSLMEFHNGRYLSSEHNYALYQEERLGGSAPNEQVWTKDAEAPVLGEKQTMRPRMKDLTGFFGNLSAKFCLRPESGAIRVIDDAPVEQGVSRETIDPSGQYRLSAAGMIAIERAGRIPVPVRNCLPTDKGHDIPEDPEKLKLDPFKHKAGDPSYRQLELFDRQAYDLKNQYARVDGLGMEHPDYDVPQEADMHPLDNEYDPEFGKNQTVELKKYDRRRAGLYIGEDGSVIIRDAWGSEIVMLGGNVQISCAGNVMVMPGRTALTIAGDDIVQKAQNSVDIHASAHDVRVSAARNVEVLGGMDDEKSQGGVVIESRGKGTDPWDGDSGGESVHVSGITLRAPRQAVVIDSEKAVLRSRKQTNIVSGDEKIDGSISLAAKAIKERGESIVAVSGSSSLSLLKGSASIVGKSVNALADESLNLSKGSEAPAIMWSKVDNNYAARMIESMDASTKDLAEEKSASGGFGADALEKMAFSFRSSEECGTNGSWTLGAENGTPFRLYEPAWAQALEIYDTLVNAVDKTVFEEGDEWGASMPWPGSEAMERAQYAMLEGKKPENLTEDGFNESRGKVHDKSEIKNVKLKGNYIVRTTS